MTVLGSSLPSLAATNITIPTITNFNGVFVYNYYTADELNNTNNSIEAGVLDPNTPSFSRNVPRYIKLSWSPIQVQSRETIREEFVDISIQDNQTSVTNETNFALKYFGTFRQQELDFPLTIQNYINNFFLRMQQASGITNLSLVNVIRMIHDTTFGLVALDQDFLNRYLNYSTSENLITNPPALVQDGPEDVVKVNVANRSFGSLFYDKVLNDSLAQIDVNAATNISELFRRQQSSDEVLKQINASQYDITIANPITTITTDIVPQLNMAYQHTGYIIERTEVGTTPNSVRFYIENPAITEFFDTQVVYNRSYVYKIYPVVAVQSLSYDVARTATNITLFLVSGEKTSKVVRAVDNNPSEPPTDFFIRWDYEKKKPVLTWNFPVDTRRHIKYFQVFRRRNVGETRPAQLPFELVRMYNFNDLQNAEGIFYQLPTRANPAFQFLRRGENNIDSSVIVTPSQDQTTNFVSTTSYVDEEFDNEGYFIYSIACVDAHGISSNYSNQLGVRWNKQRNTIDLIDISVAGAPKPYPNLYLNKDAFVDTIKNEGYSQMTVVFNPEYMQVVDRRGNDMQFLATRADSKYRIQLINTDLQQDQFFDFKISDNRRPQISTSSTQGFGSST